MSKIKIVLLTLGVFVFYGLSYGQNPKVTYEMIQYPLRKGCDTLKIKYEGVMTGYDEVREIIFSAPKKLHYRLCLHFTKQDNLLEDVVYIHSSTVVRYSNNVLIVESPGGDAMTSIIFPEVVLSLLLPKIKKTNCEIRKQ